MKFIFILIFFFSIILSANSNLDLSLLDLKTKSFIQKSHSKLIKSPTTPYKLNLLIKVLQNTGNYKNIEIIEQKQNSSSIYIVKPNEIAKIAEINFIGNFRESKSELQQVFQLRSGNLFNQNNLILSVNKLKEYFGDKGFLNANIEVAVSNISPSKLKLDIKINQGPLCRINSILINNSNTELANELNKRFKDFSNSSFSSEVSLNIENIANEVLKENKYLVAQLDKPVYKFNNDGSRVDINLFIKNDYRYEIYYRGNKEFSDFQLSKMLDLGSNDSVGVNPLADLTVRLKQHYLAEAFANIEIKSDQKINEATKVRKVYFEINEGPKVKIDEFVISGKISQESDFYSDKLFEYLDNSNYVEKNIVLALENLKTYLNNNGFLSVDLRLLRVEWNEFRSKVKIHLNLDEGNLTRLNKIEFKNLSAFKKEDLLSLMELKEGEALELNQIEKSIALIKNHYFQNAYLDFEIKNEKEQLVFYKKNNSIADLVFDFSEGHKIKAKRILIRGNTITKDYVIIKTLAFEVGEYLSLESIHESQTLLQRMGIFANIEITPLPSNSDERDILIQVRERDPGLFTLGGGVNNELGGSARVFSSWGYRNIAGSARALQLRGEVKKNFNLNTFLENKATISYLEPFLLSKKIRFRSNIVFAQQIDEVTSTSTNTFIKETSKWDFLLEKDLSRYTRFTWKMYGIEGTRKWEIDRLVDQEKSKTASVGPSIEWDYRNHPFNPTTGHYARWNIEYASPEFGSTDDVKFIRTNFAYNKYIPLTKSHQSIIAYSFRGGHVESLKENGEFGVPQEKMFFLGGSSTLRGFDPSEIPNLDDLSNNVKPSTSSFGLQTSSQFYLIKTELRITFGDNYGLVLFYDGGAVFIEGENIEDPYRDSIGIGLRYITPVGPFSIEVGKKLDKKENEDDIVFHLSIGAF